MGVVNFGINKELVKQLASAYKVNNFIETGTYLGDTSYWASKIIKNVYTIEISEPIYKQAIAKYKEVSNIEFYFGDSRNKLGEIIPKLSGPSLYWLDGHWCGRNTGGKHNECPIMDELKYASQSQETIILIDDYRYFLGPNPFDYGEDYPTLQSIMDYLFKSFPNHYITFHDDTIICVPNELKEIVDEDWRSNYKKRFPPTLKSMLSKIIWRIKNLDFTPESKRDA